MPIHSEVRRINFMQKRICYICGSVIAIIALLTLFCESERYIFPLQLMPSIVIFCFFNKFKEAQQLRVILFFSIWVALYDLLYIILRCFSNINLFTGNHQAYLQFFVPMLYSFFARTYYRQPK